MGKFSSLFKNVSYTLTSNFLSLLVSTVVTLFLPKILGMSEYGYFQLYVFYTSYVGFLHFGWCDGIYLKYGGQNYYSLDQGKFKGQFFSLAILETLITIGFLVLTFFTNAIDSEKVIVLQLTSMNILLMNMRTFLSFIMQTTNRIKEYSFITVLDRLLYVVVVLFLLVYGYTNYEYYVFADFFGKIASLLVSILFCKEIVYSGKYSLKWDLKESVDNIKVGISLMFANIASTLIIGIIRFAIQNKWSVTTFGKVSLVLSISNLFMFFVNAVSLAIFPLLKRVKEEKYSDIYPILRSIIMPVVLVGLLLYYPLSLLLIKWLPSYSDSLKYMAIVFPIIVFECKVSLLTNTYLKALRKEKEILKVNLISALMSILFSFVCVYLFENLTICMLSIVFLLAFRSSYAEYLLSKFLNIEIYVDIILECFLVTVFIVSAWYLKTGMALITYVFVLILYLSYKKRDITQIKKMFIQS